MQSLESSNSQTGTTAAAETAVKSLTVAPRWKRVLVIALRVLVGCSFILSGWAKCIDIWGSAIKIGEYLQAWSFDIPASLVYVGAVLMSGAEFVLGFLLLAGCYRRVAPWLLGAMMAFFLPLTLYIWIKNPVSDCGCFGDLYILSNRATFFKNLLLSTAIVLLILWNKQVKGLFLSYTQWIVGALLSLYALILAVTGLYSQPLVDFRRFASGTTIMADNEDTEEAEYSFIYEKDGETAEFTTDNLPDSTWSYVDRRLISGSEVQEDAFTLYNGDEDVAAELVNDGQVVLFSIPDADDAFGSATIIDDIAAKADSCGYTTVVALGDNSAAVEKYVNDINPGYAVVSANSKQLKELVRGDISVVFINNGVIVWKRTLMSIPRDFIYSSNRDFNSLTPPGRQFTLFLSLIFLGVLTLLFLADRGIFILNLRLNRRR